MLPQRLDERRRDNLAAVVRVGHRGRSVLAELPVQVPARLPPPPPPKPKLNRSDAAGWFLIVLTENRGLGVNKGGAGGREGRPRGGEMSEKKQGIPKAQLSDTENLAVGMFGGLVETFAQMPLITWKISSQEGRPMPKNVLHWFRGVLPNAGALAPITAVQVASNGMLERVAKQGEDRPLTKVEQIGCAMGAGGISSIIYSPVDLCVIQQQGRGKSPFAALGDVVREHGAFTVARGFWSCVAREAVYTAGYLALAPIFKDALMESSEHLRRNEMQASLVGSCAGGTLAGLATHPIDTAKTRIQGDLGRIRYASFFQALNAVYQESGLRGLYSGGVARTARICGAFFIVSNFREQASRLKAWYRPETSSG